MVTIPGRAGTTRVADVPDPVPQEGELLLRTLEVGVCGTDREIADGLFGVAPDGEPELVLGHELLAEVLRDGRGHARGDLVAATVRRSCYECGACAAGSPDACQTGRYRERGITRLHGYAGELVAERAEHVVALPRSLGRLGVLAEPASVCERGLRHARAVGSRQPWREQRALVLGTGAIGMLATYLLRLTGCEVWTSGLAPAGSAQAQLVEACGARYANAGEVPPAALAQETGGFDLLLEATGDSQAQLDGIGTLRRNGVACLLGLDARPRRVGIDSRVLGVDVILQNRAVLGSVSAHVTDWRAAAADLVLAYERWPDALEAFVDLRVPLDRFGEAFEHRGVKATLSFS